PTRNNPTGGLPHHTTTHQPHPHPHSARPDPAPGHRLRGRLRPPVRQRRIRLLAGQLPPRRTSTLFLPGSTHRRSTHLPAHRTNRPRTPRQRHPKPRTRNHLRGLAPAPARSDPLRPALRLHRRTRRPLRLRTQGRLRRHPPPHRPQPSSRPSTNACPIRSTPTCPSTSPADTWTTSATNSRPTAAPAPPTPPPPPMPYGCAATDSWPLTTTRTAPTWYAPTPAP